MKALVLLMVLIFSGAVFAQEIEVRTPSRNMNNIPQTLMGSVSQGTPTAGSIPLSIADAIDRALKYNLCLLYTSDAADE